MTKTIFGVLLTLIGVLLLLFNFDVISDEYRRIILSWEMLLITTGSVLVISKKNVIEGTILILIGTIFILPDLFDIDIPYKKIFWPALFIISGVYILLKKNTKPSHNRHKSTNLNSDFNSKDSFSQQAKDFTESAQSNSSTSSIKGDAYYDNNFLGGTKKTFSSQNFIGGEITNALGGYELDLTQCKLADGVHTLHISTFMGGIELIVPADMYIENNITTFLGGFDDKRKIQPQDSPHRKLILTGSTTFGGGVLR